MPTRKFHCHSYNFQSVIASGKVYAAKRKPVAVMTHRSNTIPRNMASGPSSPNSSNQSSRNSSPGTPRRGPFVHQRKGSNPESVTRKTAGVRKAF